MLSAAELIRLLDLKPHPEGGHFRETFRDPRKVDGARAASTVAYYLLARGERSPAVRSAPSVTHSTGPFASAAISSLSGAPAW